MANPGKRPARVITKRGRVLVRAEPVKRASGAIPKMVRHAAKREYRERRIRQHIAEIGKFRKRANIKGFVRDLLETLPRNTDKKTFLSLLNENIDRHLISYLKVSRYRKTQAKQLAALASRIRVASTLSLASEPPSAKDIAGTVIKVMEMNLRYVKAAPSFKRSSSSAGEVAEAIRNIKSDLAVWRKYAKSARPVIIAPEYAKGLEETIGYGLHSLLGDGQFNAYSVGRQDVAECIREITDRESMEMVKAWHST